MADFPDEHCFLSRSSGEIGCFPDDMQNNRDFGAALRYPPMPTRYHGSLSGISALRSDIQQCRRAITALSGICAVAALLCTSLPACGGALQTKAKNGVRASSTPFFAFVCGERGIRTPGPVKINGFQDRRIRPLCHLSNIVPLLRDCKGTNKFHTCKLFFTFFFLGEEFILEKQEIDCSAGHTTVSKVEYCTEECARIIHPR